MTIDVTRWLAQQGLERYAVLFQEQGIRGDVLGDITDADLKDLGVTLGDRKRLLRAIATLSQGAAGEEVPASAVEVGTGMSGAAARTAERRQITVMFIDLVGSTTLASSLDPEDMRDVIAAYQNLCTEVVGRYDGYVAKFMGDGVLVYFGWPAAHEDDAERAVRAGLELTSAVGALKLRGDLDLAVRIGISTGPVVVGDLVAGGTAAQEQAVVGETPNIAARIQNLAPANTVVIGPGTRKLAGETFEYEDLGEKSLAGVSEPVRLWRVVQISHAVSRFEALHGVPLAPLIGRDEELAILTRRWEGAKEKTGQIVLLSAEAGIGKSRLVHALRQHIAGEPHTHISFQCSPLHIDTAFYPVSAQLEQAANFSADDHPEQKLDKLRDLLDRTAPGAADVAVFAALLSLPGGEQLFELEPESQPRKERIFAAFLAQLGALAAHGPVLCVFEDVHWSDPSTLEFLQRLAGWVPSEPVLLTVTCRPDFVSPWSGLAGVTTILLARMSESATTELITHLSGDRRLPDEVVKQITDRTDGIPLFVEELTQAILDSGVDETAGSGHSGAEQLSAISIPTTLHDSLLARLDRLPKGRGVAQLGAVIGRSFDYRLVSAVSDCGEASLRRGLTQLENAGLLVRRGTPPDAHYSFRHALIQEAAYRSLLRTTRQEHHHRIATALEASSGAAGRPDPELLAHHFLEAGRLEPAIRYYREAGENAIKASAHAEAISNFKHALDLIGRLTDRAERIRNEIPTLLDLGGAQVQNLGPTSSEVEKTYRTARDLTEEAGSPEERFTALWGLWFVHYMRGDVHGMRDYADQLLPHAEQLSDAGLVLEAHHVQWASLSLVGDLNKALAHTEEGIARYNPAEHHWLTYVYGGHDPGLCAKNLNAVTLCILGYPEEARRRGEAAVVLAQDLGHPYTLMEALFCDLVTCLLVRNPARVEQHAGAIDELIQAGTLPGEASGLADGFRGWTLAEQGSIAGGLELMRESRDGWQSFFGAWCFPLDASMAELLGRTGHPDEGITLTDQALRDAEDGGAHWWDAELLRVRAELHWTMGRGSDAEQDLQKSLGAARERSARAFELRAGITLCRMYAERKDRQGAHDVLAPIYGAFTEGFETPDLLEAASLLRTLRRDHS